MLLNIHPLLPAVENLQRENIYISSENQPIKNISNPLKLAILNLMPTKITTETDFLRLLSVSPLPVEIDFIRLNSHQSKNTPEEHLSAFYKFFSDIAGQRYDGLIITGAPVELLEYPEVTYWDELTGIFDWASKNVTSTLYICWAAQAALNHFYGVPKYPLSEKMFGIFRHSLSDPASPLFRGFDDEFFAPHSRHTEIRKEDLIRIPELQIASESEKAGVCILTSNGGREIYITGHFEYAPDALNNEYFRDVKKGLPIRIPENYYKNDNPENGVVVRWRAHANLLFQNWLHHFCVPRN